MNKYKNIKGFVIPGMIMIIITACIACSGNKTSVQNVKEIKPAVAEKNMSEADYSGIYRLADTEVCSIVITIKKVKSDFIYTINGTGVKSSGKLSIVKDNAETYLIFTGTKRNGDKTAIEGAWSDRKIIIQNYGNSINQYVCFKICDSKFLEFVRAD
ncbi:MAG TPA: hypothetical protein PLY36_08940 [Spirochaetota bacterium]|nr:hypothetical protein [Spirochaetota bacterium]